LSLELVRLEFAALVCALAVRLLVMTAILGLRRGSVILHERHGAKFWTGEGEDEDVTLQSGGDIARDEWKFITCTDDQLHEPAATAEN
jgi:hypothetical protein